MTEQPNTLPCTNLPGPTVLTSLVLGPTPVYWTTDVFLPSGNPSSPYQEYGISFQATGTGSAVTDESQYVRAVRTSSTP